MKLKPRGVFLSNGPGDPFVTSRLVLQTIKKLIKTICLYLEFV